MQRCLNVILMFLAMGPGSALADARLQGAGSTFVNPMMQRWVSEYQNKRGEIKIDYQSIGSGGGVKAFLDKTVDFAASDAPLNKKEIATAGGAEKIVEFPIIAGGVVPAYNLPGVTVDIKFSGSVLADIFLGQITKWNDPQIAALNAGVNLPDVSISPAWRTDASGTTFIFTSYLSTQSGDFKSTVGAGKQVKWPAGTGGKGNEGVAAAIQQTAGGIGYIEQAYADENHITYGSVQNKSGVFVKSSPDSISRAIEQASQKMHGNLLVANLWNQEGQDVYPIASFTYVFVYNDLANIKSQEQAQALVDFLAWATHDGQSFASDMHYAALSQNARNQIAQAMLALSYNGTAMHPAGAK